MTALADALTLSGRQLLRLRRYPSLTVTLIALPLVLLLVFTFVFGGTLGAGISGVDIGGDGRAAYLDYIVPGLLLLALASAAQGTAITVAMDQTGGIITRLRTMGTPRPSILSAHVVAGLVQSLACAVPVALVAVALGWRPDAGIAGWLAVLGLVLAIGTGLTWVTVAMGAGAPTVEAASNTPMILTLLPLLSSGFVPTESFPVGLRWFADHQPATPMVEALRVALAGDPGGAATVEALAWCVGLSLLGLVWARRAFDAAGRRP